MESATFNIFSVPLHVVAEGEVIKAASQDDRATPEEIQ